MVQQKRIEPMMRSAASLIRNAGAVEALLVMAQPQR